MVHPHWQQDVRLLPRQHQRSSKTIRGDPSACTALSPTSAAQVELEHNLKVKPLGGLLWTTCGGQDKGGECRCVQRVV